MTKKELTSTLWVEKPYVTYMELEMAEMVRITGSLNPIERESVK